MSAGRPMKGPYPPGFPEDVSLTSPYLLSHVTSGEITTMGGGHVLGVPQFAGYIKDVNLTLQQSGRDDADPLWLEADILINGVSAMTTKPKIEANVGSASERKSTINTGTGITQADIDETAMTFAAGDVISLNYEGRYTATPTTKMANPVVVVELAGL